ncbi:MAG: DNRLRE domain-containing protein [Deltaproteobacteria bacterium]|nr:DNRLRE domain-containing protein [Deltaproteobacteria bacterium]
MRGVFGPFALVLLSVAACSEVRPFRCQVTEQCGAGGRCEPEGYCSFVDPDCGSGRRFGEQSPGALANLCVGAGTGSDAGSADADDSLEMPPQPAQADTFIDQNTPGMPHGNPHTLRIDAEPLQRGLLRFEPTLPAGAELRRAELRLHIPAGGQLDAGTLRLYAITESWDEAAATWTQRSAGTPWSAAGVGPASRASSAVGELDARRDDHDHVVRLPTALVAGWLANPSQNFGLVLVVEGSADQGATVVSREDPDPSQRPRLVLRYRP